MFVKSTDFNQFQHNWYQNIWQCLPNIYNIQVIDLVQYRHREMILCKGYVTLPIRMICERSTHEILSYVDIREKNREKLVWKIDR